MKYTEFTKQAYKYTPADWKAVSQGKHYGAAARAMLPSIGMKRMLPELVLHGPLFNPIGLPVAACTPSWDEDDAKKLADHGYGAAKQLLIPGSHGYYIGKLYGYQRNLQRQAADRYKARVAKKQTDSKD